MASWRGSISALVGTVLAGSVVGALGSPDVAAAHGADRVLDERTSAKDIDARIDAFWRWWRTAAPRLDSALEAKQTTAVTEELSAQIGALDPRLAWETGPGLKGARHQLVLSAEGDIALRAVTER